MKDYFSDRACLTMESLCKLHGWAVSDTICSIEKMTIVLEDIKSLVLKHPEIRTIELLQIPSFIEGRFSEIEVK